MNLARAGRPSIPLYGNGISATSNVMRSVLKLSSPPKVTGRVIFPLGLLLPGLIPWKEPVSSSSPSGIWSFLITAEEIKFSPAPPSTNILVTLRLRMVGERGCAVGVILKIENDGRAGPFEEPARLHGRLCCVHLSYPLLKLAVGGVQRGAAVNA